MARRNREHTFYTHNVCKNTIEVANRRLGIPLGDRSFVDDAISRGHADGKGICWQVVRFSYQSVPDLSDGTFASICPGRSRQIGPSATDSVPFRGTLGFLSGGAHSSRSEERMVEERPSRQANRPGMPGGVSPLFELFRSISPVRRDRSQADWFIRQTYSFHWTS